MAGTVSERGVPFEGALAEQMADLPQLASRSSATSCRSRPRWTGAPSSSRRRCTISSSGAAATSCSSRRTTAPGSDHRPGRRTRVSTSGAGPVTAGAAVAVRLAQGHGHRPRRRRPPFHDAAVRRRRRRRWAPGERGPGPRGPGSTVGELLLAPGVPATLDSGGLRPAHVHVRPVRFGQDLLARAAARAGAGRDHAARRRSSTRTPTTSGCGGSATAPTRRWPRATPTCRPRSRCGATTPAPPIRCGCASPTWTRRAGGRPRSRPDPRPRRVRRPHRPARAPSRTAGRWSPALDAAARVRGARGPRARPAGDEPRRPRLEGVGPGPAVPRRRAAAPDRAVHGGRPRLAGHRRRSNGWWPRRCCRRCGRPGSRGVPCLVVIDEAHNICPADPPDPVTALSTDKTVQIAAEGRKYGLYLLRPPSVRTRCTRTSCPSATTCC